MNQSQTDKKLSTDEIERLLTQGQQCFKGERANIKVFISMNRVGQYKAIIDSKYFNCVFQKYNEFNGLNYWLEPVGSNRGNTFFEDLAIEIRRLIYY